MMRSRPVTVPSLSLALGLLVTACGGDDAEAITEPEPTSDLGRQGEEIYRAAVDGGNTFSCSTCHALTEPAVGLRRVGHQLGDAAGRPSYKNGALTDVRDAVNSCLTEWMDADAWEASDARWTALDAFLTEISPATAPALRFEIAPAPSAAALAGGDAEAGREVFNETCAACHGTDGVGESLTFPIAGRGLDPQYIGARVRTSGPGSSPVYSGLTGGKMPFWAVDRLSDSELADMVAWLSQPEGTADGDEGDDDDDGGTDEGTGGDESMDDDGPGDDGSTGDDGSDGTDSDDSNDDGPSGNCDALHPKIGQTAELVEAFHDVGGTATIIDDCTIRITDFTYDAAGIDVRLYGALGGAFESGFPMGDDLVGPVPYMGETLDFELPDGMTMDDLDSVSIWCVDFAISFGDGSFS